jgi:hypothetical protein
MARLIQSSAPENLSFGYGPRPGSLQSLRPARFPDGTEASREWGYDDTGGTIGRVDSRPGGTGMRWVLRLITTGMMPVA